MAQCSVIHASISKCSYSFAPLLFCQLVVISVLHNTVMNELNMSNSKFYVESGCIELCPGVTSNAQVQQKHSVTF